MLTQLFFLHLKPSTLFNTQSTEYTRVEAADFGLKNKKKIKVKISQKNKEGQQYNGICLSLSSSFSF